MTWPEALVAAVGIAGVVVVAWRYLAMLLDLASEREGTWIVERAAPEAEEEGEQ